MPAAFIDTLEVGGSQGFNRTTGGNPNLTEESADTFTIGAVFRPPSIPRLSLTVDYFDITVDDAIATVDAQLLVNTCFQTLQENSLACDAITRNASGNIDQVRAPLLNIAKRRVRGLDLTGNYGFDLPDAIAISGEGAKLSLQAVASFQFEDSNVPLAGVAEVECAGFYGGPCSSDSVRITPDFRAFVTASYTSGPLTFRNQVRYIDDVELSPLSAPTESNTVSSQVYWDIFASFDVMEQLEVFGGFNNLLDNQPPVLGFAAGGDANTNVQLYDVVGRQFFVGAKVRF